MSTEAVQHQAVPRGALILNAGVLVLPVALGYLFAAALKALNPSGIDVTQELAYLRPILIVTLALVGVFFIAAVAVNATLAKRGHPAARWLWTILVVQLLGLLAIVLAQLWEGAVAGG